MLAHWLKKHTVLFLIAFTFVLYIPSLFGGFVWDDQDFIYDNTYVQNFQIGRFFTDNNLAGRGLASNYYRPIQQSLYSMEYQLVGKAPWLYHLTSVFVHIAAGVLLYFVARRTLKTGWFIAFFAAFVFLIHPVQTESVSYLSGRSDSLYVLFLAGALLVANKDSPYWRLTGMGLFTLSLLSKETALIFVAILPLVLWLQSKTYGKFGGKVLFTLPYFFIAVTYLLLRFTTLQFQALGTGWENSAYVQSLIVRLATYMRSFFIYGGLLVFPGKLHMERDVTLPVIENIASIWTALFIAVQAGALYASRYLYQRNKNLGKLAIFSYISFNAALGFYSGMVLLNGIFYEHYLYFALFFFVLFIGSFAALIPSRMRSTALIIGYCFIAFFVARGVLRQFEWINPIRFYQQTLYYAPESLRIENGLAMSLSQVGRSREALKHYQQLIKKDLENPVFYHNAAQSYVALNEPVRAENYYQKAIDLDPNFHFSYNGLFELYVKNGEKQKLAALATHIEQNPLVKQILTIQLAQLYEELGEAEKALYYYRHALTTVPQNSTTARIIQEKIFMLQSL